MPIFFTSDTHFGDHRVLNIHKRPFASLEEMDRLLVRNWNRAVGADDEVWHLGDFCRSLDRAEELLSSLNGRKHLVRGNNDPAGLESCAGWESVQDYRELGIEGRFLVLCHYPFRSWNRQHKGAINLHGHSHGKLKPMLRQIDVGVDVWDFGPVTLDALTGGGAG